MVQAEARVKYLIRSTSAVKVKKLYERVCDVAKGAALITGTKVDILFDEGLYDTMPNFALEDVLKESYLRSEFRNTRRRSGNTRRNLKTL